ncbi:hypothetical protein DSO57_1026187 [Entomophthora muscae]|uniref:Uncharacterized protein n=1 Tax=Entomophthora muscae TaxID=34485 RepID=A0ACC2RT76_9FUNG|nr:hypothetical protein DSO57_1026187 [Entomophthora muscae]
MATLEGYKAYSPTWEGVGTQFGISLTISLACLGAHEALRARPDFRHLFSARSYLSKSTSPLQSPKFLGWVSDIWKIEETFILHNIGLDAVLYLRFLKMLLQIVGLMVISVMPILLPLDYINREVDESILGTVQEFSITGVGSDGFKIFIHALLNSSMACLALVLIYRNTVEFVQLRRIHFLKEANDGNPRCRTVMVTNIPDPLCDEDRLRDHFESLGLGEVHCVQLLRYPAKLIEYRTRRKKALLELEKAHTQMARALLAAVETGHLTEEVFVRHDKGWEYNELLRYLRDPFDFNNTPCPESMHHKLMLRHSIETGRLSVWDLLFRLDSKLLAPYQPRHRTEYKTGRLCHSIDYWFNKLVILDRRIQTLRSGSSGGAHLGNGLHTLATSTAFVTFANPASAQLCAQSIIHPSINCCQTYLAPEPKDILWHNHTLSRSSRISRKIVVNAITWALIILWLIPVVFLLPLLSFDSLSKKYPVLMEFSRDHPWAESMLQTLVPATLLAIFMSSLPHIIFYVTSMEAWKTFSLCERAAAIRYYYFCVFNVLLLFLLGPSIFTVFLEALNNKFNAVQEFATRIPRGAAFFINYVIFNTCYQFMELLCLGCPLVLSLISWSFPNTPRERQRMERTWAFPYYYYIPNHLLIFVIVLTYSTVNPIMIPVGGLYFLCTYFIFKNQFVYSYIKRYESNGRIWNLLVRFLTDGVILAQMTTASIVTLKGQYYADIPIVITLFATFYFKYYYRKTFRLRLKYVPLVSLKEAESSPRSSIDASSPDPPPSNQNPKTPQPTLDESAPVATNYEDIEEQRGRIYFAQAFSHPAMVKPIPMAMLLAKNPEQLHYDLYNDVLDVDFISPTPCFNAPRDMASPTASTGIADAITYVEDGIDPFQSSPFANYDMQNSHYSFTESDLRLPSMLPGVPHRPSEDVP